MRRVLPAAAAVLCGLVALVDFFLPNPQIDALGAVLTEGVVILGGFALLLGVLNILGTHLRRMLAPREPSGRRPSRVLSLVLVLALVITFATGILEPFALASRWVFSHVYGPLQSSMMALMAFFIVSALCRAFRLQSVEALILTVSSILVLVVQMPFAASISPKIPALRDWILAIPVGSGIRGMVIGIALGTMAASLRILFLVDSPYLGEHVIAEHQSTQPLA